MTADAQSFSRAAAKLNIKQSTLSRRVMQLEEQLGVKLFERTTRGAEPTENGKVFIEQDRIDHGLIVEGYRRDFGRHREDDMECPSSDHLAQSAA